MDHIKWCSEQSKGIQLVKPNETLSSGHFNKAKDALNTMKTSKSRDWQITTAYYAIYHSIYSLLMKLGIKSEIHSCTIEFTKIYLKEYFTKQDFELIDLAFNARIDSQYYVNRKVPNKNYKLIINKTAEFLVKCKNTQITNKKISQTRKQLLSLNY